jgi:hypothetical protein
MFNDGSSPTLSNCLFVGNTADASGGGGGMYNQFGTPALTFCTFSGNLGADDPGAISNYGSSPTFKNCILWGDGLHEILSSPESRPTFEFSDLQGGVPVDALDGGWNIDMDPMFVRAPTPGPDGDWDGVDDDFGDLHLQFGSPCRDAGDPNFSFTPGETDLDGYPRVLCYAPDLGAYEFGIGNRACDEFVDLYDFMGWQDCTTDPQIGHYVPYLSCESYDFDADGDVDLRDCASFQNAFGPVP